MALTVVFDTNILFSATGWRGKPFECVEQARAGKVQALTCAELIEELAEKLELKLGFSAEQSAETLADYLSFLRVVQIPKLLDAVPRDPDDNALLGYEGVYTATALVERRKEYIEAAISLALSRTRILWRHLLPNCLPPLIVVATVQIARAITLEATLSFLGLGLPITEPSLGLLIANGFEYLMSGKYWISFFPGVALLVTIVSINLIGDHLRDVLNPRLRR